MTKEEALQSLRDMAIINGHSLVSEESVTKCLNCYMSVYKPSVVELGLIKIGGAPLAICSNTTTNKFADWAALGKSLNISIENKVFRDK